MIDKEVNKLAAESPALCVKTGYSQTELSSVIGISRQTYSIIETRKKDMLWLMYLSMILVFSQNENTTEFLDYCGAYPDELKKC